MAEEVLDIENQNDPLGILSKKNESPNTDPLGILKKKDGGIESSPIQSKSLLQGFSPEQIKVLQKGVEPNKGLVSTTDRTIVPSNLPEIREAERKKKSVEAFGESILQSEKLNNQAIQNTIDIRKKDPFKITDPTAISAGGWTEEKERQRLLQGLKNGEYQLGQTESGKPIIQRVVNTGIINNFINTWQKSYQKEIEDAAFNNLSPEEKQRWVNTDIEVAKRNEQYLPKVEKGIEPYIGETAAGLFRPLLKGMAYSAGAAALAPELGVSAVLTPLVKNFGTVVSFVEDLAGSGSADNYKRTYKSLKDQGYSDSEAHQNAEKSAAYGEAGGILQAGAFGNVANYLKGIAPEIETQGFVNSLKHMSGEAFKQGAFSSASSLVSDIGAQKQGLKITPDEILANAKDKAESMAGLVVGLGVPVNVATKILNAKNLSAIAQAFGVVLNPEIAPKPVVAQAKGVIAQMPDDAIKSTVDAAEQNGIVPPGTSDKVINDINKFKEAGNKIPSNLNPEMQYSLQGIQEKIDGLEKQKNSLDKAYHPYFDEQIDGWRNKAKKIIETGDVFKNETDELGNPIDHPVKDIEQKDITVGEMLDKSGTYDGKKGIFYQDGQAVIFKPESENREYELGNVDELSNKPITELGIKNEESVVSIDEKGNLNVRGKEYVNRYSDPTKAINTDDKGNILSVNLETPDGQKRTFRGAIAEDLAYQIKLGKEAKPETEVPTEVKPKQVSISVAPFYDTQVKNVEEADALRESEGYKKHLEMLNDVAKKLGLDIAGIDNTIGGFENAEGNKITEISNRVILNTDNLDEAEKYAAIVGGLAHETQEATIAAKYVNQNDPNRSAIETDIKVDNLKNAIDALKAAGISNFEINQNENSIKILDFDDGKNEDFNNKVFKFADELEKNNVQYEAEHHAIESRYVDPQRRSEVLEQAKKQAEQSESGADIRNLYETAAAKSEEFIKSKEKPSAPPTEIPKEIHTPIVDRLRKGLQKLSDVAKISVLNTKNFDKALDEAIKTGGVNLQSWGGFEKRGFEESPQWQKLIDDGTVKLNFDLKGLEGKPVVVINPDNMLTGEVVTKNGKPIVDGNGGINFVTKFGDVWASSDNATANTLARYINEAREKDLAAGGNGTVHVVVTKGDLSKSLTSHTGAKAAMKVLEHLVDKKYISLSDFRKALIEVGKKYDIDFDGRMDAKSIHDDIANKFFGVKDSTFSKRGFFVQDIIDNLAKNSTSAKENITKIRNLLNTEVLPKSTERKTGEISFAKEGIIDAIGHLLSDNMTVGVKNSEAYATIEVKHPVEVFNLNKEEGGHESYPFHLRQIDENGNKVKPVLNVLREASHVTDVLNDANNNPVEKKGGAGKFGSNQIGMAKGYVKSANEFPYDINLMTDSEGKIYGFEHNGKIVLNSDLMNGNTPFHEAGHLWINWAKKNRSDLHDAGMDKVEGSKYLQDVKNNPVYQENASKLPEADRENYFKSEALAKAIGDNGELFVNESKKADFKDWLKGLWETIATHLGLKDMTAEEISNLTLDDFSKKIVAELTTPEKEAKLEIEKEEPVIEEPKTKIEEEPTLEEIESTSIKNKTTAQERKARGLDEVEVEARRTLGDVLDKAKESVDKGEIDPKLLAQELAKKPRALKAEETGVLLYDRMRMRNEYQDLTQQLLTEENDVRKELIANKLAEIEKDMIVNDEASRLTGYEQGLGLAARKMMIAQDYSLLNQLTRFQLANAGEELSESQKDFLKEKTKEIQDVQKKLDDYEEKKATDDATKLVNQEAKNAPKKTTKTSDEFKAEREKLIDNIKDKWNKASKDNTLTAVPVPYAKQLAAISPDVLKLVKSYAEQGIVKLDEIVDDLHTNISKIIPEITKKDVVDILAGEYKEPKKIGVKDPEKMRIEANLNKIKNQIEQKRLEILKSKRSDLRKGVDWFQAYRRAALLSGIKVIGKLGIGGTIRAGITQPLESAVGYGLSKLPFISRIAEGAPREGTFSRKGEAAAFAQFIDRMTYQDIRETLKTGRGQLDELFDKKLYPSQGWLDFFGNLHSAIKVIPKRAEYFRALEYRSRFALKNGENLNDPLVQQKIATEAYGDALRSVYMQDNFLTNAYKRAVNSLEKSDNATAKASAEVMKFLLPIVKVPTNYVAEQTSYLVGGAKAAMALRKGISELTPEQKDYVMRALKKQTIGAAFIALGYMAPNAVGGYYSGKRKKDDLQAGDLKLFDTKLPHWMLHTPLLEALQVGATLRRAVDASGKKGGGVAKGLATSAKGVASQLPFYSTPSQVGQLFEGKDRAINFLYRTGESVAVPQLIKEIAEYSDIKDGELVKRDPKTFSEFIKSGIPGLREQVKAKKR